MTNASLSIAWSIAEIEASAAGFDAILPNHFWIGCCKGCDLDYARKGVSSSLLTSSINWKE
jgi:hypothetical protein